MIAAVILAAGEASRFGSPKQRLLLPSVLERVHGAVDEVVVVEGAHALQQITDGRIVPCPDWALGPGASLRCGLKALGDATEAAVVVLADGPELSRAAIARLVERWRVEGGDVLAASYGGERGHPLLVARSAWADVPDEGLRARPARLVSCDDLGAPGDVDRVEDLPAHLRP